MGRRGGRTRPGGSQGTGQDAGAFLCRCGCSGGPASFSEEAGGRVGEGSSAAGGSCRPRAGSLPGPGGCERAGCRLDWRTPSPSRPRGPRRGALQRGDSRLEPAPLGPSSWALLPRFAGRRRICHHEGSLLPVCHAVHSVRFLCDFFHYPRFLLIPWLPVIKVS